MSEQRGGGGGAPNTKKGHQHQDTSSTGCTFDNWCMCLPLSYAGSSCTFPFVVLHSPAPVTDPAAAAAQVIDIPNSMTVLPELIPLSLEMVRTPPPRPTHTQACCSNCAVLPVREYCGAQLPLVQEDAGSLLCAASSFHHLPALVPPFSLCAATTHPPSPLPRPFLQARRKLTGIMNFTNPGAISHNEVCVHTDCVPLWLCAALQYTHTHTRSLSRMCVYTSPPLSLSLMYVCISPSLSIYILICMHGGTRRSYPYTSST